MDRWGERLRARAKELGLTDADVARRLGITQGRYSTYVNMTREPDFATFSRMCKALQTTPDEVLGFSEARRDAGVNSTMIRAVGLLTLFDSQTLAEAADVLEVIARHRAGRGATGGDPSNTVLPKQRGHAKTAAKPPPPGKAVAPRSGRADKPSR